MAASNDTHLNTDSFLKSQIKLNRGSKFQKFDSEEDLKKMKSKEISGGFKVLQQKTLFGALEKKMNQF